jgi:hypothetical protein
VFSETATLVEAARADRDPRRFERAVQAFLQTPGLDAGGILFAYHRLNACSHRHEGVLGSAYWLFAKAVRNTAPHALAEGIPSAAPDTYAEFLKLERQKQRLQSELSGFRIPPLRSEVPGYRRHNPSPLDL